MRYQQAAFAASYGTLEQMPPSDRMEIAFAGRSNVGKSSLLNRLFSRKNLARVSSEPGKTATVNFYSVDGVYFVDLPGYGYAKVSKKEKQRWSELIEGYFRQERDLGLVVQLIDMRHPPTELDLQMLNFLVDAQLPFVVVLTKADKLNKTKRQQRVEALRQELPYADQVTVLCCSSETGEGIDALRALLDELVME